MTTLLFYFFFALRRFLWSVDTFAVKISILTSHSLIIATFLFLKTSAEWVKCFHLFPLDWNPERKKLRILLYIPISTKWHLQKTHLIPKQKRSSCFKKEKPTRLRLNTGRRDLLRWTFFWPNVCANKDVCALETRRAISERRSLVKSHYMSEFNSCFVW